MSEFLWLSDPHKTGIVVRYGVRVVGDSLPELILVSTDNSVEILARFETHSAGLLFAEAMKETDEKLLQFPEQNEHVGFNPFQNFVLSLGQNLPPGLNEFRPNQPHDDDGVQK